MGQSHLHPNMRYTSSLPFVASLLAKAQAANVVTSACDAGDLVINIPDYTVQNSEILALKAGTCSEQDTAHVRLVQTADVATLRVSIKGCALDADKYANPLARSGFFTGKVHVELGKSDSDGNWYRYYNNDFSTECGMPMDYEASYSYGYIDDESGTSTTDIQASMFSLAFTKTEAACPLSVDDEHAIVQVFMDVFRQHGNTFYEAMIADGLVCNNNIRRAATGKAEGSMQLYFEETSDDVALFEAIKQPLTQNNAFLESNNVFIGDLNALVNNIVVEDYSPLLEGTYGEVKFTIKGYSDADMTKEFVSNGGRAGDMVYLRVIASGPDYNANLYNYAVRSCTVKNLNDGMEMPLFAYNANQCENDFIGFSYKSENDEVHLAHKLFVSSQAAGESTYSLSCNIKLCEDADGNSLCEDVRAACDA